MIITCSHIPWYWCSLFSTVNAASGVTSIMHSYLLIPLFTLVDTGERHCSLSAGSLAIAPPPAPTMGLHCSLHNKGLPRVSFDRPLLIFPAGVQGMTSLVMGETGIMLQNSAPYYPAYLQRDRQHPSCHWQIQDQF